jgi:hypothetical protein
MGPMKPIALPALLGLLALGLAGHALASETVLAPVGPEPAGAPHGPLLGYLRVYTPTEAVEDGENFYVYPHTAYRVTTPNGAAVAQVDNHRGLRDEEPADVALPPGRYVVHAPSDRDGFVAVPVIVKAGRATVVDLEAHRIGGKPAIAATGAAVSPHGQTVGWRAE